MKRDDNGSDFDDEVNFAKPPEKSIQEIVKADNDDPSLVKYKQELLGSAAAASAPIILRQDNPERVIVTNISLISDGQVKRSMDLPGPADFVLAIKEGCSYNIRIQYYVQREIVSGLRYQHKIKRLGVSVEKETYMFGSFAPRHEIYEYTSPPEEAPSGLLHRGKYSVTSLVRDDDDHVYLKWNWVLEITKECVAGPVKNYMCHRSNN
uniref:Rho GDP-dissociation inhibitor 1 n=1 Tax=Panagrolaimus sp. JU765 TaxID=591449 RepID=A0AC34QT75_9BILA